jgi:hypothetical protein
MAFGPAAQVLDLVLQFVFGAHALRSFLAMKWFLLWLPRGIRP